MLAGLRTLRAVAFATYKEWAAYRSHMLLSLVIGPAFYLAQVFIWKAVYTGREEIAGFSLSQMLYYYGAASILHYVLMDFADWNLSMLISTGRYLTFALRPVSHIFFALSQKVGHRVLGLLFELLPVWLIFALVFRIPLVPARPLWAVLSALLGFLMMFLVDYSIGCTAFWMTRTDGVRSLFHLFRDALAGAFVPLALFPDVLQKVLFFLPFQFITYVPVQVFIGSYSLGGISLDLPQIVAVQALAVILTALVALAVYRRGMRRYTGVGV